MRNVFDQYSAPENRLTHALACCLSEDRRLLRRFIQWTTGKPAGKRTNLKVVEQHVPGQPIRDSDEGESFGLPDMWIHDDKHWSLIVESKVASPVKEGQLHRHLRTARRNDFADATLLVISPERPARRLSEVEYRTWTELFRWMRGQAGKSEWAVRFVDYIQIAEERMAADGYLGDRTLTVFDGIPFDSTRPYSYGEAKGYLRRMMDELRKRDDLKRLGIESGGEGRPAITGQGQRQVWDIIPLRSAPRDRSFTSYPHLTVALKEDRLLAVVITPHGLAARYRRNLTRLGMEQFTALTREVANGVMRAIEGIDNAYPLMQVLQRRYPSRRSMPITDALLAFDLRTAITDATSGVKFQEQWVNAAYDAFANKRSNLQLAIGAGFPYGSRTMKSRSILEATAKVWIACEPWLRQLLQGD